MSLIVIGNGFNVFFFFYQNTFSTVYSVSVFLLMIKKGYCVPIDVGGSYLGFPFILRNKFRL